MENDELRQQVLDKMTKTCPCRVVTRARIKEARQSIFDSLEEEWNRRYEQYKRYVSENKTLYVPKQTVYENENLGSWILTQKHRFKVGKLSEERIKKLEKIDKDIFKNQKNRS